MLSVYRLGLGMALLALAMAVAAETWTGGRGDGNRGSFPELTFPISPATPAVVWKAFLGPDFVDSENNHQPPSNTVISRDMVIFAYGRQLVALSKDTGEFRWQQPLDELPLGDILLLDGQLIVCGSSGLVHALNPADGSQLWQANLTGGISNGPVCTDSALLFSNGLNQVVVIARKTGNTLTVLNADNAGDNVVASPLVYGKSFIICYSYGTVKRIEADSMVLRWSYTFPRSVITITPVTDGKSLILLNTFNTIIAFTPSYDTRSILWAYPCVDRLAEPVALDGDRVFVATHTKKLIALDARTGRDNIFTTQTTDKDKNGKVVTRTEAGIHLPAMPVASPLVFGKDHKKVLLRMENGLLGIYSRDTGEQEWLYSLKSPFGVTGPATAYLGAPAIEDDSIYFAASDGIVYHLSNKALDVDPPTITQVLPSLNEKGFLSVDAVVWLGATIDDEGTGVQPSQVTMRLDDKDLTAELRKYHIKALERGGEGDAKNTRPGQYYFALKTNQYYYPAGWLDYQLEPGMHRMLEPGMHRLVITAADYRGNKGTKAVNFFIGTSATAERVPVTIAGEFLPKHLQVRAGTIITWKNTTGSPRTIIADKVPGTNTVEFSSDAQYPEGIPPGEVWAWIVPAEADPGTKYYYHCRLNGKEGDGTHFGSGLVGLIEVVEQSSETPGPAGAHP